MQRWTCHDCLCNNDNATTYSIKASLTHTPIRKMFPPSESSWGFDTILRGNGTGDKFWSENVAIIATCAQLGICVLQYFPKFEWFCMRSTSIYSQLFEECWPVYYSLLCGPNVNNGQLFNYSSYTVVIKYSTLCHGRRNRQKRRQRSLLLLGDVLECRNSHLAARMIWRKS